MHQDDSVGRRGEQLGADHVVVDEAGAEAPPWNEVEMASTKMPREHNDF